MKKYSVNDSVWIAAAIMAYEKYNEKSGHVNKKDMYFKQAEIVKRAQLFAGKNVDAARVSWWVNADNGEHTQNYLRADLENDSSKRRLSMMDEFEEKSYPDQLNSEDELDVNGKSYSIGEIIKFVKNDYCAIIKGELIHMAGTEINYIGVLEYLKNNQEIPYSDPEASGITNERRQELLEIKQRGQDAVAEMKKMASRCSELYGLDKCMASAWLDGSNTKTGEYLWTQMKYKAYEDNPISISLFAEKNENAARYRISLEIKNNGTDKQIMTKYHSYLNMPVAPGMVFVAGNNEWGNPAIIEDTQEAIKEKVERGEVKKVQLCMYVEPSTGKTNQQYNTEVMEAVKRIIPYYEYVIGKKTADHRVWLLTWNPANWSWDDYKEQCVETKQGEKFTIGWTCSSKQPEVGDELFLVKTGDQPRGIMAHGHVVKAPYAAPHYDPEKAEQGVTTGHIDAEYDWIQDYEMEKMLLQEDLKRIFPDQQWSPMESGIEIKNEYVKLLDKMWRKIVDENKYWPSLAQYNPEITKEKWLELLSNKDMTPIEDLRFFKCWLLEGGESTCANAAEKFGGTPAMYNMRGGNYADKAKTALNIEPCNDDGKVRTFPIVFLGRNVTERGKKRYSWKLRNELKEALEDMDLSDIDVYVNETDTKLFDKNMILYGPPGTGKTYNTAIYAVAICDNLSIKEVSAKPYAEIMERYKQLKDVEKRVAFTTFHQSYGYEEFVEGIKPRMDNESRDVEYTIKDGVFKAFCDRAGQVKVKTSKAVVSDNARIWNVILGGKAAPELKQICFKESTIRIGWSEQPEIITEETEGLNDKERRILLNFQDEMEEGDIVVSRYNHTSIDGIGIVKRACVFDDTVEGYPRKRDVDWIYTGNPIEIISLNGEKRLDRKSVYALDRVNLADLLRLIPENKDSELDVQDERKPYVFIIDEINRGNISKIFGELITLIEPTKRKGEEEAMEAMLPYSNKPFGVPGNVYLIGTMNTADRSIALMDTALRRRFQFEEMMPNPQVLRNIQADKVEKDGVTLDVAEMLEIINQRIEYLYDREHTIGHAFFTELKDEPTVEKLASIFMKSVIPLLQEYFYEDYSKIMLVLGDNGKKNDEDKFILAKETKASTIFRGDASDIDIPDYSYEIQKEAFNNIMSYVEIKG